MKLGNSVLATLSYHNIFNYPLNFQEIELFLIENKSNSVNIQRTLNKLIKTKKIGENRKLFYLAGRQKIVQIRKKRESYSLNKLKRAKLYVFLLKIIPTIKLIALTGALSMNNSTKDDDIDLLIITSKNTLWTTRLMANLILLPYKRTPKSTRQKNKACLNIFIDESNLKIKDQNLYTAHEIAQLKPLLDRDKTYNKFIKANQWLFKYLPNWKLNSVKASPEIIKLENISSLLEPLARTLQQKYMKSKVTTEKIGDLQLFFHPTTTQDVIIKNYNKAIKKFRYK